MRPRAIFFDLDDTLADRQAALERYAERLSLDFSEQLGGASAREVHRALIEADDFDSTTLTHQLSESHIWVWAPEPEELDAHWEIHYGACATPFPGAVALLERLASEHIALGIITNGPGAMQRAKIATLGIAPLLDAIVISGEVGLRKPDRRIFEHATGLLGLTCDACWFVGDNPEDDVRGAHEAGLTAFWVKTGSFTADAVHGPTLAALTELTAHLDTADS